MTIRLPFPPSVNTYWRVTGNRVYLSAAGKRYRADVQAAVLEEFGLLSPTAKRLRVAMELTGRSKADYDIDNYPKGVLDSLVHAGVMVDDEQVDELIVKRLHVEPPGCCDVTIEEVGNAV